MVIKMYIEDLIEDLKKSDDEDSEVFEFEYAFDEEMLIVNHQEGFSYNMCYEDDVYSVAIKLNEQQSTISTLKEENNILKQKLRKNYIANKQYEEMKRLQKENEQLKEEIDELKQKEEVLNRIWRSYLENDE